MRRIDPAAFAAARKRIAERKTASGTFFPAPAKRKPEKTPAPPAKKGRKA